VPAILSRKDVVVAAETGSGKTHGYLVPLIDRLCSVPDDSADTVSDQESTPLRRLCLVLCPNVLLCEQVVRMANGLCGDDGEPLLRVASVCGRQVFYFKIVLGYYLWIQHHFSERDFNVLGSYE
jgi:superfamily II DNA/RNA helicase